MSNQRLMKEKEKAGDGYAKTNAIAPPPRSGAPPLHGASATWTQALPDWCASHVRALNFFNGVPEIVVPDNLRSAITRAHRYEPDAHPTYTDLAEHYGFAIVPARVRRPRDKSLVS